MKPNPTNLHLTDKKILIEKVRTIRKPIISIHEISEFNMENTDVKEYHISFEVDTFTSALLRELFHRNWNGILLKGGLC